MEEILPGLHHWTAVHPKLGIRVHCHYAASSATLLDPLRPEGTGMDWFGANGPPGRVVLSNRHHLRDAEDFAAKFDCPILCNESGLHEFEDGPDVEGFSPGDELAPGLLAVEVGAICPDDTGIRIDADGGALLLADAVINYEGIGFVPDHLLGEEPEQVKRAIRESLRRVVAEEDFEHLLFAHGEPIIGGGRERLAAFAEGA